jgi:hypothetical protein
MPLVWLIGIGATLFAGDSLVGKIFGSDDRRSTLGTVALVGTGIAIGVVVSKAARK